MDSLAENLARIRERLHIAALRAGRDPASITLVAVSKTHPAATVRAALALGLTNFGENRIEEAAPKMSAIDAAGARWHMIGHIQSRKARAVAEEGFVLVHSVDSYKLAERLSQFAQKSAQVQPILLECNVSGEAQKAGFNVADPTRWAVWLPEVEQLLALPNIQVQGLMTMAPIVEQPDLARPYFARLRELQAYLIQQTAAVPTLWRTLSMGMTDDFEAAIAEGATLVRIGRALFGTRA